MAARRKRKLAINKSRKRAKPSLAVNLGPALKQRIKVAAAAQKMPVSSYVVRVLEDAVPLEPSTGVAGRKITLQMMQRAAALRKEQSAPFKEDSVELVREARRERDAQL